MKIFVTGTDTGVGKTTIASWICSKLKYDYWKPIQTGVNQEITDSFCIKQATSNKAKVYDEEYCYTDAVSPNIASKLEGKAIDINFIKNKLPIAKNLVVEGIGGVLVPLNDNYFLVDLIRLLSLPTILVATTKLGTINHTLLSIEALKARGVDVIAVVLNGEDSHCNYHSILDHGKKIYSNLQVISFPVLVKPIKENLKTVRCLELEKILKG